MNSNEFSLYILLSFFIFLSCFCYYSLCFGNKKVDTITIERHNPGILIASNGVNIIQAGPIQDYCAICNCYFKNGEEVEILNCNHIYHRNCYKEKMGCVKCLTGDYNEHAHLLV
jgi:hypothetical protein